MNTPQPTLPDDLQERKDQADVAKAEAEARKSKADADKAETEAEKQAMATRREAVAALIPDFSKVKDSTLDVKDSTPMWGTFLTFGALKTVAESLAATLLKQRGEPPAEWRILITSEPDLASSDAIHGEVMSGLTQLVTAADKFLEEVAVEFVIETAAALAAALPGVLSLFSAHRTTSTAATAASDLAAAASVAGALKQAAKVSVVHDQFRLVPVGAVYEKVAEVAERRQKLVAKKLQFSDEKSQIDAELAAAKAATPRDDKAIATPTHRSTDAATRLGLLDSVITAIDTFTGAIRTVSQNGARSPLASAALREALHEKPGFTHVLLVKAQAGQAQQQLDNRPLFFKDKFSTIADTSIAYVLIDVPESNIIDAGTVTGLASVRGKVGDSLSLDPAIVYR